jgi:hypothetical protein
VRDNTCYKSYDRCVDYKGSSSGGCYLTSACMQAQQEDFDDDCFELTVLRRFRDEYVSVIHPDAVRRYYEIAPRVVDAIDAREDRATLYQEILERMVYPTVTLVGSGRLEEAYEVYQTYSESLERRLLRSAN